MIEYKKMVYIYRFWAGSKYRYMIRNLDKTSSGYHYFDRRSDCLRYCDDNKLDVIKIYM